MLPDRLVVRAESGTEQDGCGLFVHLCMLQMASFEQPWDLTTINEIYIWATLQGQLPKEKKRTPAWTDRILYKSPAGLAKQTYYSSANLLVSDHKPVSCRLSLTVGL